MSEKVAKQSPILIPIWLEKTTKASFNAFWKKKWLLKYFLMYSTCLSYSSMNFCTKPFYLQLLCLFSSLIDNLLHINNERLIILVLTYYKRIKNSKYLRPYKHQMLLHNTCHYKKLIKALMSNWLELWIILSMEETVTLSISRYNCWAGRSSSHTCMKMHAIWNFAQQPIDSW